MATQNAVRRVLESEYRTWAQICLDKHGSAWPVKEEDLPSVSDEQPAMIIKSLRLLGRTPHEG